MHPDFALLAPIPAMHLESALAVAQATGFVSFGSQKWELFREVDKLRLGADVPVLIYPSHERDEAKVTFRVTWSAWYIGHTDDGLTKREDEKTGHRPPTTFGFPEDNSTGWAIFWRVRDLTPLAPERQCPIKELESFKTEYWRKNAPPRGPEIIARPNFI